MQYMNKEMRQQQTMVLKQSFSGPIARYPISSPESSSRDLRRRIGTIILHVFSIIKNITKFIKF